MHITIKFTVNIDPEMLAEELELSEEEWKNSGILAQMLEETVFDETLSWLDQKGILINGV